MSLARACLTAENEAESGTLFRLSDDARHEPFRKATADFLNAFSFFAGRAIVVKGVILSTRRDFALSGISKPGGRDGEEIAALDALLGLSQFLRSFFLVLRILLSDRPHLLCDGDDVFQAANGAERRTGYVAREDSGL